MKHSFSYNTKLLLFGLPVGGLMISGCNQKFPEKPNIILIMADDLGYGELGCYGQEIIKTPNIDRIANEGIKFSQFYAGSAVSAPSRSVLLTGKHTGHSYIRNNGQPKEKNTKTVFPGQNPIPDSIITVAELLKEEGYNTACIGKWGLGSTGTSGDPGNQGFDLFYGFKCQVHAHNHYPRFLWRNNNMEELEGNDRILNGAQHSQDLFTNEALKFINNNKDSSFFLYLPLIIPHLSIQTTDKFLDMYKDKIPEEDYKHSGYIQHPYPRAAYAGMISQMDDGIGQILDEIKKLGIDKNTLIIFTSDNGPTYNRLGGSDSDFFKSSGKLRGKKGSLYEGGIRVPLVLSWSEHIVPGSECKQAFALWDILPTICELAGTGIAPQTDGISFLPVLTGIGQQEIHSSLYWEFPAYGGQAALIKGDMKLVITKLKNKNSQPGIELFNISKDTGEIMNILDEQSEIADEMINIMKHSRYPSSLFKFPQLENFLNK